jgi:hypothetical protein
VIDDVASLKLAWYVSARTVRVQSTPGDEPLERLAAALLRLSHETLIVGVTRGYFDEGVW